MTTRTQQRHEPRWVLVFLAAMVAALVAILVGNVSSASAAATAETRVGASSVVVEPLAGPPEHIAAGQRLGNDGQRVVVVVATGVAANTPARFAVNSAGEATMSLRAGSSTLEVTEHAALRMAERGVSIEAAERTLAQQPFRYFHDDVWKTGYYDPTSRLFLGSIDGRVTTVINRASQNYINNLKAAAP